jgi:hypothetical protein
MLELSLPPLSRVVDNSAHARCYADTGPRKGIDPIASKWAPKLSPKGLPVFSMESPDMSDHQLRFKGPGFDFDAKGWVGILAAIFIVVMIVWLCR